MKMTCLNGRTPVFVGAVLVAGALIAPAMAQQTGMPYEYQGTRYIVSPDNSKVLRVEALAESAAALCTRDNPCRYDDLPDAGQYVAQGNKWTAGKVTYSFQNDSPDVSGSWERGIIAQAFGLWTNVAKVYPSEVANGDACTANIKILWGAGSHGDAYPFDGPGGALAHTFYPPPNGDCIAGDAHFDEGETWVSPTLGGSGIDLATVAAHEFGHALGLNHSADPNALMAPYYIGRRAYLSWDDIAGIRAIYGANPHDLILQVESVSGAPPGGGSFRLLENQASIKFHKTGTVNYYAYNKPSATSNTGGTSGDVDGVLSRGSYTSQFDGYWWHVGDLFRSRFTLNGTWHDVDEIQISLRISDNVLNAAETLVASLNGKKLGDIVVNPGDTTVTLTVPVAFANPANNAGDAAALHYGAATH